MRIAWQLVALGLMFAAAPAPARDLYVNNLAGEDRYTGAQATPYSDGTGPVRTIAKALRLAQAGDRIVLAKTDQPYRESITLCGNRHSGYAQQAFTIQGNGAVLDGSLPVPPRAWEHYRDDVFRFQPPGQGTQQLYLDGRPAVRAPYDSLRGGLPRLEVGQWCLADGRIYFRVEKDKLPESYDLSFARLVTGVTLYHVEHVAIVGLTIQGFQNDGLNAFNSARRVYLAEVMCRGNGRSGLTVGGASQVEIDVCMSGNNGEAQLLTLPYSHTQLRNSRLLGNTAPGWVDQGGRVLLGDKPIEGGRAEVNGDQEPPSP